MPLKPARRPALPEEPAPKGRVVTFYSYKGGTGRSMALANVAWVLALSGQRVLVVDWDLEAPGLHRFFHPFLSDKELSEQRGLLDYVENLAAFSATGGTEAALQHTDVFDYIVSLEWPCDAQSELNWQRFGALARIDLLGAGRQGPAYSTKLATFDWVGFYERLGGRALLDAAMKRLRSVYDFVLIDSRTGVSDTSGICTVELPDVLVIGFTLNNQSIRGASAIADSVIAKRGGPRRQPDDRKSPVRIFPVPMRVEVTSEHDKRTLGLEAARQEFARCLDHSGVTDTASYWGKMQMAYFPYYAFEEIPAAFGDAPNQDLSLSTPVRQLANVISDGANTGIGAFADSLERSEQARKEVLGWYLRQADGRRDAEASAQRAYDALAAVEREQMLSVLARLIQIGSSGRIEPRTADMEELGYRSAIVLGLEAARVVAVAETQGGKLVSLRDPQLAQRWPLLREWIAANEEGIVLRQTVTATLRAWRHSGQDESALLRGRNLRRAIDYRGAVDFNRDESEFLAESAAAGNEATREVSVLQVALAIGFTGALAFVLRSSVQGSFAATDVGTLIAPLLRALGAAVYYGMLVLGTLLGTRSRFGWRDDNFWAIPTCAAAGVAAGSVLADVLLLQFPVLKGLRDLESGIRVVSWYAGIAIGLLGGLRLSSRTLALSPALSARVFVTFVGGAALGMIGQALASRLLDFEIGDWATASQLVNRSAFWIPMLATVLAGTFGGTSPMRLSTRALASILVGVAIACLAADMVGAVLYAIPRLDGVKDSPSKLQVITLVGAIATGLFFGAMSGALAYLLARHPPRATAGASTEGRFAVLR